MPSRNWNSCSKIETIRAGQHGWANLIRSIFVNGSWRRSTLAACHATRSAKQFGVGISTAINRERGARQDGRSPAKADRRQAPGPAVAKDQGGQLHAARTGRRACRTRAEGGLPHRLDLRSRRDAQLHKKRGGWRAIVPTAPDGAHSRQSTKTRSRPSGWSSSMRLGPRPTWRRCGDGRRRADGSKPKSRTVAGIQRHSWRHCITIGSQRRCSLMADRWPDLPNLCRTGPGPYAAPRRHRDHG